MSLPSRNATCHPDRKHEANGLCASCYNVKERVRIDLELEIKCGDGEHLTVRKFLHIKSLVMVFRCLLTKIYILLKMAAVLSAARKSI